MSTEVSQDSGKLREIAAEIKEYAEQFLGYTGGPGADDGITAVLNKQFGESEGPGVSWYGPNAVTFLSDYNAKCPDEFLAAYNNIISLANNLEEQAAAWETFENTGV